MVLGDKTRRIILISATAIIILCIVWYIVFGSNSEMSRIASFLRNYGYDIYEDELLIAYDNANTTIAEVLQSSNATEADIQNAVNASKQKGFSSDIQRRGGVTLILANCEGDTVTLYLVDGEKELCFVQGADSTIKPLGDVDNG